MSPAAVSRYAGYMPPPGDDGTASKVNRTSRPAIRWRCPRLFQPRGRPNVPRRRTSSGSFAVWTMQLILINSVYMVLFGRGLETKSNVKDNQSPLSGEVS